MKTQDQFSNSENCKSKQQRPKQLEIFPEQIKPEIARALEVKPENIRQYNNEIEPLDSNEM
jgi:hypothetical protein